MKLLKEIIDFNLDLILLELRTNFNFQQFKGLTDLNQEYNYAKQNLKSLGAGSSREAFLLSNRYVLKIAIPNAAQKGIAQNKAELEIFTAPGVKNIVSNIYGSAPNGNWLVSELVRPITDPKEFEQLSGIPWATFQTITTNPTSTEEWIRDSVEELTGAKKQVQRKLNNPQLQPDQKNALEAKNQQIDNKIASFNKITSSPFIKSVMDLMKLHDVNQGDLKEIDHWGKSADGRVVLLDYGLTNLVGKQHYAAQPAPQQPVDAQ